MVNVANPSSCQPGSRSTSSPYSSGRGRSPLNCEAPAQHEGPVQRDSPVHRDSPIIGHSSRSRSQSTSSRRSWTPKCQIYQGPHYAAHCPDRYARNSNPAANIAQAFHTQCSINPQPPSNWYVDSGASAHMTSSTKNLDDFAPYSGFLAQLAVKVRSHLLVRLSSC